MQIEKSAVAEAADAYMAALQAEAKALLRHLLAQEVSGPGGVPVSLAVLAVSPHIDPSARSAFEKKGLALTAPRPGPRSPAPDRRCGLFVFPPDAASTLRGTRWERQPLEWLLRILPGARRCQRTYRGRRRYGIEVPLWMYLGESA